MAVKKKVAPEQPLTATEVQRRMKQYWKEQAAQAKKSSPAELLIQPVVDRCLEILKKHGFIYKP